MASNYPNGLDNFSTSHVDGEVIDNDTDNDQADALNKIERELGINPSGTFADIVTRLGTMDLGRALSGKGFVNHGTNAATARPSGYASVEWFGSVAPNNAVNGDTWINTA